MANENNDRRLFEAAVSFIVPGFGQLLQERLGMAISLFIASLVAWPLVWWIGGGFIFHVIAAIEAYWWKGE